MCEHCGTESWCRERVVGLTFNPIYIYVESPATAGGCMRENVLQKVVDVAEAYFLQKVVDVADADSHQVDRGGVAKQQLSRKEHV